MKLVVAIIAMLLPSVVFPQHQKHGPGKPPPPEKRWERDSLAITTAVVFTTAEYAKVKVAFMDFYKGMDALHDKQKGQPPAKEAVDGLIKKRNEAIRKVVTKASYDKYMTVEKKLGPQKPKNRPQ